MEQLIDWLQDWKYFIIAFVTALLAGWAERRRTISIKSGGSPVMSPPRIYAAIGAICSIAFIVILSLPAKEGTDPAWTYVLFITFVVLGFALFVECAVTRHVIRPEAVEYRLPEKRGRIAWRDISSVEYAFQHFWITGMDGRRIRVYAGLKHLPEFARAVLDHRPKSALKPDILKKLEHTAQGNLPNVY